MISHHGPTQQNTKVSCSSCSLLEQQYYIQAIPMVPNLTVPAAEFLIVLEIGISRGLGGGVVHPCVRWDGNAGSSPGKILKKEDNYQDI